MGRRLLLAALTAAAAAGGHARTPLTDAAQALLAGEHPALRYTVYGETELAPLKIVRDHQSTYLMMRETGQKVEAFEVTAIGYRRLPTTYEAPYLVVGGFVPSMAISYPGRKLVFVEFGPELQRQPASPAELQIAFRARSEALLEQQTRLESARAVVLEKALEERVQAESTARATQLARSQLDERQRALAVEQQTLAREREAVSRQARRAFSVYRNDKTLRGVLARWASNDGLQLEWSAPEDRRFDPEVAADGAIDASDLKSAMRALLAAFSTQELDLVATFYNNGVVEISRKDGR